MAKKRKKFDLATQERLCAMVSVGTSVRSAALLCDTTEATVRQRQLRDPAFRQRLTEAKQLREIMPLKRLREAAATNWRAAAWLLQRIRPEYYAGPKPDLWRTEDVSAMMCDFADMLVKALKREVGPGEALSRVCQELRAAVRNVDDVQRSGSDLVARNWPKVRQGRKSSQRGPAKAAGVDGASRPVDTAEEDKARDRDFPGHGAHR
ncbi:MAG: hypothetical protein C0483_14500 [Pirellula sp.]|nr:hypothetical protein [Pirellula sp.]